jgi:hypothetical protein
MRERLLAIAVAAVLLLTLGAAGAPPDTKASRCPADVTADGVVDTLDLIQVIMDWGVGGGTSDVNTDDTVDVQDLILVMLVFGPCVDEPNVCPGSGDCFAANATRGCDIEACCDAVCTTDVACCEVAWDTLCAQAATHLCLPYDLCPGEGDCFLPHAGSGCDEPECCATVCGIDPYCCSVQWDAICADAASAECPATCVLECPASAATEAEACGTNTNGGCNSRPAAFGPIVCGETVCGTAWSEGGIRDTDWYLVTIDEAECARIDAGLVSEFPGVVYIVGGLEECNAVILGDGGEATPCASSLLASTSVGPGTYVVFVSTEGYDRIPCGEDNAYQLDVLCTPVAGPCD